MSGANVISVIILLAIIIAIGVYLLHWLYRHSSKDLSFVRTGLGGEKVVMGGGALVLPIVHEITEVSMKTLRIEIRRAMEKSLITKNRMRIEVIVEFFVRVIPTAEAVSAAARTVGNRTMDPDGLRDLVQGRFVDAMGAVAARMAMEEIHENRSEYITGVKDLVSDTLTANGLELEAVSLTRLDQADIKLFNPSNAFDAEGLTRLTEEIQNRNKKRNDIEKDTMIAIRSKDLDSEKLALSIDQDSEYARLNQEREIAMRRAQQRAEIELEKTDREREIDEAQLQSKEQIEKARFKLERSIDAERIRQQQEAEALEIQRQAEIELETTNRERETKEAKIHSQEQIEKARFQLERLVDAERIRQQQEAEALGIRRRAEIDLETTNRERETQEAQIHSQEQIEKARFQLERLVDAERIRQQQEAESLEIQLRRTLELEEQERAIAIALKSKEQSEAQTAAERARAEAVKAQEKVITLRESEIAERRKLIELLEASQQAEREAIKIKTAAAAELVAAGDRAKAQITAADAAQHRYAIDAEGKRKLNDSENMRSDNSRRSALQQELIKLMPTIIRESVKPMENIESIKILQVDGLPGLSSPSTAGDGNDKSGTSDSSGPQSGSLADNVVNSALRYRTQIPFVEGLLREIGMPISPSSGGGGLTIFPVGEDSLPADSDKSGSTEAKKNGQK